MAEVRYGGPILPPNPGATFGYGTPPIAPGPPGPSYWDTLWDVFLGDLFGKGRPESKPAPGASPSDPHFTPTPAGGAQTPTEQQGNVGDAGFCFGFDHRLCDGLGLARGTCLTLANISCLALGVIVLAALLGIGLHSLVT